MEEMCNCKSKIRTKEEQKQIINRLNRIIGQMNGIKNMIEDNRYCDDILIQLSAVDKSIKSVANMILNDHMHTCLIENINSGNYEIIDDVIDLIKRFQ